MGDIKQLISSETQKSKGKKGKKRKRTDDLDDEQDKTSGCGPTIAQEYVDQLITWIEEEPDAKPSALTQRLHAMLNYSSDLPSLKIIGANGSALKSRCEKRQKRMVI